MSRSTAALLAEALLLPANERGDLAARILDSLDTGEDADAAAAWGDEVRDRLAELDAGTVATVPWAEARRLIMDDTDATPDA